MAVKASDQGTAAHEVLEKCIIAFNDMGWRRRASDWAGQTIRVTDGVHGDLSPSAACRWQTCPGSVAYCKRFPEALQPPRDIPFTQDDAAAVQECLDYVFSKYDEYVEQFGEDNVELIPERRVSLEPLLGHKRCDGTSDAVLKVPTFIHHIDYKHGVNVPVPADDPQNAQYLLGTLAEDITSCLQTSFLDLGPNSSFEKTFPYMKAFLTIVQPRCFKISPSIRTRVIEDLPSWILPEVERLKGCVSDADKKNARLVPTKKGCRFCSAKLGGPCKAHTEWAMAEAGIFPSGLPVDADTLMAAGTKWASRDPNDLSDEQIRAILAIDEVLSGMLKSVSEHAKNAMLKGEAGPTVSAQYKLVRGTTQRKYHEADEKARLTAIRKIKYTDPETQKPKALTKKEVYKETFLTVKQLEDVFKSKGVTGTALRAVQTLFDKPEGKPTIVPVSDRRTAIEVAKPEGDLSGEDVFANC